MGASARPRIRLNFTSWVQHSLYREGSWVQERRAAHINGVLVALISIWKRLIQIETFVKLPEECPGGMSPGNSLQYMTYSKIIVGKKMNVDWGWDPFSGVLACLACTKFWVPRPALHSSDMVVCACNLDTREVEPKFQRCILCCTHPKVQASLGYLSPCLNEKNELGAFDFNFFPVFCFALFFLFVTCLC